MSHVFVTMPQLGESVTEGTISRWLVNPGDSVVEFDAMVEINTDKVDAEVPSPVTGVLIEILAPEGAVVPVGGSIAVVEVAEAAHDIGMASGVSPAVTRPPISSAPNDDTDPADPSGETQLSRSEPAPPPRVDATPPRGAAPAPRPWPVLAGDETVPLTPVRRRIAETMAQSKATIPHAWQTQEVDMSGVAMSVAANRGGVRRRDGASLTYLSYVLAAVASSLCAHPVANSTFADDHVIMHREINIGVAVGLPSGVIVPVIRAADRLSITEFAVAVTDLNTRAREKRLTPADLAGSTIIVNNSGALGTLLSYSVITPGHSAVVTMGAVVDRPVAVDGKAVVRPMMYLSLSLDHRVMDGLEASAFLGACRQWLEGVTASTELT
jgi:2-oxoisovalerate dehydrogenase E2 component (dihydrolipoyl transacylase)